MPVVVRRRGPGPIIEFKTTVIGLNQYTKKLAPEVLYDAARKSMVETLREMVKIAKQLTPEASGRTASRITSDINGVTLQNLNGRVYSPDKYFRVLEYGRRPGAKMPPNDVIFDWIGHKDINPYDSDGLPQMISERKLVFLIRRAIGRRGIPALHIMRNTLERSKGHFSTTFIKTWLTDWRAAK